MAKDPILPMNVRPLEDPDSETSGQVRLVEHLGGILNEWKNHRRSVIEDVWTQAYENFNGIFDEGVSETKVKASRSWRSKAFYPLTEQKVTAAQAQLQDILFKGGRFPYDIKTSPIPDDPTLAKAVKDTAEGGASFSVDVSQQQQIQQEAMTLQDLEMRIKNMKKRIDDQIAESDATAVGLRSLFDGALYGTAFLEAPKVVRKRRYHWKKSGKNFKKVEKFEDVPTVVNLSPWDCWPDPECGGMVDEGIGFFHRQNMALSSLQELYSLVFPDNGEANGTAMDSEDYEYDYLKDEFKSLVKKLNKDNEGSRGYGHQNSDGPDDTRNSGVSTKEIEVYTFSGVVQNRYLTEYLDDLGDEFGHTEVIVVMCTNHIIKCVVNPFPAQRRPYHMVPWTKVPGSAFGRGVGQKIFDAQKNVNRLMRMYIDNKRLSGNLMTAIDKGKLKQGESLDVYPGRNWEFDAGYGDNDVRKLLQPVYFPDVTAGVLEAIGTMVQWADQSSGVPRILEGQPGDSSSTAYAENQRITAASKQLGLVLKNYDNHAWVPIIEAFYDWNMEFLKDPDVKGDFSILATGFSTFENRQLKKLDLERLLLMSQQMPALANKVKADPIVEDWAVAGNIDPDRYLLDEKEVAAKMEAQKQEQLQQMEAAMNMDAQKQQMEHQMEMQKTQVETELSGQVRMALAQINAASKQASDQMKSETQRLIKLADIESKEKGNDRGGKSRGNRGRGKKDTDMG